jgi:probable poly-beta-1,6-N-acetyl-D-glucosamine export protein
MRYASVVSDAATTSERRPSASVDASSPARAVGLDVLRGIGALAVVILHVSADPLIEASLRGRAPLVYLLPNLATRFAVPAFVLLSGLGLSLSRDQNASYLRFLARRVSKILPAYVVWSLIYSWTMPSAPDSASPAGCLRELFTGTASFHLYFVTAILRLYVLYRAIVYVVRRFWWGAAACCALSWLMIWLEPILASNRVGAVLIALVPLRYLGYFAVGARMAQLGWSGRPRTDAGVEATTAQTLTKAGKLAAAVAVVSLGLLCSITRRVVEQTRDIEVALGDGEWLILPYSLAIVVLLLSFVWRPSWVVRALSFVSAHSFGIYLSHVLMLKLGSLALHALCPHPSLGMSFAGELALGFPLTFAGALLSDRAGAFFRRLWAQ